MKSRLQHATISLRVPSALWDTDDGFATFCDFASEFQLVEEYAFFSTPLIGTPFPLDWLLQHWEKLGERIAKTRDFAPRVGINNLVTTGHNMHNAGKYQQSSAKMVSQEGVVVDWKYCHNNPQWREEYIKPIYTMLAECNPDFIWIDDDLRLHNFGTNRLGCFCPYCFEKICQHLDFKGDLPELKKFLEVGTPEELRSRHLSLLEYNSSVMVDISRYIEQVVHGVNPQIILGQMDALSYWELTDRAAQVAALAGPQKQNVWWRPGGGFYTDKSPDEIITKANSLAAEISTLPETVTVIQSEIENFYFPIFSKSRYFNSLEAQLYCAASGCSGTAYSIIGKGAGPVQTDPLSAWEPLVHELKRNEDFIELIVANNKRLPLKGIWTGIGKNYFLANNHDTGEWLSPGIDKVPWHSCDLNALGLPPAFRREDATVTILGEREVVSLSDDEILDLLSGGLYIDVPALDAINKRDFAELTGFAKITEFSADAVEAQTAHPLNDFGNLYRRNVVQAFWGSIAYSLQPAAGAQIIGRLVNLMDEELAACSSGIFENRLGGRIAVIGYAPWHGLGYAHKIEQVRKIFDWLSSNRLPGRVDSLHRSHIWIRTRPDGGTNVTVLNSSMDKANDLVLRLNTQHKNATLHRLDSTPVKLIGQKVCNSYTKFVLPELGPWCIGYLITE